MTKNINRIILSCKYVAIDFLGRERILQMEQIHKNQLEVVTGERKLKVGSKFPTLSGHWSGGSANEGGIWHDGSAGGTVNKIVNEGNGSAMARCNALKSDGTQCGDVQPVQVLQ